MNKIELAYKLQGEGSYEQALGSFREAAQEPALRERALFEAAKTLKMMNRPAEAIAGFIEVLRAYPLNREAVRELGETARLSNDLGAAADFLESLSGNAAARLELGKIFVQRGDLVRARAHADAFRTREPENLEVNVVQSGIYAAEGNYDAAVRELEAVRARFPDDREANSRLGELLFRLGRFAGAAECFERVRSLSAHDKDARLKLVELYALAGEKEKSDAAGREALGLVPKDAFSQDATLNDIEILQRKTELRSKVKRLWVTVTSRCNIRCKTCGLWHSAWDLPYKTAQEIMDLYPYLERVVWLGGEVFLYKHFEEMFDRASQHLNMKHQVITNGVILNERWIDKIVNSPNTEFTFSVDGTTREVYESIRHGSNFEKLLSNIRLTMEKKRRHNAKLDVRMNAVIMRTNYLQIEEFVEFAAREGFNQLSIMALHFDLAPEENIFYDSKDAGIVNYIGRVIPKLRERAKYHGIDLDILLPPGDIDFSAVQSAPAAAPSAVVPLPEAPKIHCKMPWKYLMICDKGDTYLTGSCVKSVGNIYTHSIGEIWNSGEAREYRRSMIENRFEGLCRTECMSRW